MNEHLIVTIYTVNDDLLRAWNYQDHCLVQMSAAEVLTVAVMAAHSFQNHYERTLCLMHQLGDQTKTGARKQESQAGPQEAR